jgi:hypothetical protein
MKNQLLLLCLLEAFVSSGQIIHPAITSNSFPGTYSLHFTDIFSFTSNPSALANLYIDAISAGISTERKFMLQELSTYRCVVAMPVKTGAMAITLVRSGSGDFNESQAGWAYAKKLGKIDVGIQFNYTMLHITGSGNDAAISIEAGTSWHITDKLHAGFHIVNPRGGQFSKNRQEKLATVVAMGMDYEVSEQLLVEMEIIKEEAKQVNIRASLEYLPAKSFIAMMGVHTATASPFFGAGWSKKNFRTDISVNYHFQLGVTPGIRIIFYSNNNKHETGFIEKHGGNIMYDVGHGGAVAGKRTRNIITG